MTDRESELRARIEVPLERAVALSRRTMKAFPIRVWRRFLRRNGFLLSAGMAYQGLFAVFGLLYIAFAAAGIWLGGSETAIRFVIDVANSYIPGIVGEHGLVSAEDVSTIASSSAGVLSITGAVAAAVVLWTAITAITFTRRAVRDIFGLPYDTRSFVLLKIKDVLAAFAFGLALLLGSILGFAGVWALRQVFDMLGWSVSTPVFDALTRIGSILVMFLMDSAAIAMLVRFLSGTRLGWRTILPGSMLGGGAVVVLQLGAGLLLAHTPGNPLLATFAVVVAMLLWCRWVAIVVLVAASWIALAAEDGDEPLEDLDEAAAHRAEQRALLLAARLRMERAEEDLAEAPWWRRASATRALRRVQDEWADALAEADAHGIVVVSTDDPAGPRTRGRRNVGVRR